VASRLAAARRLVRALHGARWTFPFLVPAAVHHRMATTIVVTAPPAAGTATAVILLRTITALLLDSTARIGTLRCFPSRTDHLLFTLPCSHRRPRLTVTRRWTFCIVQLISTRAIIFSIRISIHQCCFQSPIRLCSRATGQVTLRTARAGSRRVFRGRILTGCHSSALRLIVCLSSPFILPFLSPTHGSYRLSAHSNRSHTSSLYRTFYVFLVFLTPSRSRVPRSRSRSRSHPSTSLPKKNSLLLAPSPMTH
jgi:hypothetical protein